MGTALQVAAGLTQRLKIAKRSITTQCARANVIDMKRTTAATPEAFVIVKVKYPITHSTGRILSSGRPKINAITFFEVVIYDPEVILVPRSKVTLTKLAL
jgi:hypothetical protein